MSGRLLLIGPLPPPYGGTEVVTELLQKADWGAWPMSFFDSSKPIRNDERGKLRPKNVGLNMQKLSQLTKRLWVSRPSFVWLPLAQNVTGFLRDSAYVLLARVMSARAVLHFNGATFDRFYAGRGPIFRWYVRLVLRRAHSIVVPADRLRSQFEDIQSQVPVFFLHNALTGSRYAALSSAPRTRRDGFNVVFIGHVSEAKGALDLIRAVPKIVAAVPAFRLRLAGQIISDDSNSEFMDRAQRKHSDPRVLADEIGVTRFVDFLGPVSAERVVELLREADVFALPSYSEGFSIAMLEAMAAGLPLVLTPVGAAPEILAPNENCLFVTPGSPPALAEAVCRLAADAGLRERMAEANRRLVSERFLEQHFSRRVAELTVLMFGGARPKEFAADARPDKPLGLASKGDPIKPQDGGTQRPPA